MGWGMEAGSAGQERQEKGKRLGNECVVIDCIVRVADQGPACCGPPVHLWTMQSVTPHCSV